MRHWPLSHTGVFYLQGRMRSMTLCPARQMPVTQTERIWANLMRLAPRDVR